jgi:hypothetical protein
MDDSTDSGQSTAAAIAQIFTTGVTAYTDSQAIQAGYTINNPQYFSGGYPAGVPNTYTPTSAGAPVAAASSSKTLILVAVAALVIFFVLKK